MSDNDSELKLRILAPPFVRAKHNTQQLMFLVIIALLPAIGASYYFFGSPALMHVALTMTAAILCEVILQWLLKRPITISDGSAAVTGLLLGMNLPPAAPYWLGPVGALMAIAIVKQVFGGLGQNFMNPALAARALMIASWPSQLVAFVSPFDAVASATPLAIASGSSSLIAQPTLLQLFLGEVAGCIGETSTLALCIGGIFLIMIGVIDFRIPTGILATVFVLSSLFAGPNNTPGISFTYGLYQLLSGGIILGAFFMATDYVTSPVTLRGRWVYGIAIGLITVLIRFWGRYPEGTTFAILLMNIATPLIERFTMPKIFGEVKSHAQ